MLISWRVKLMRRLVSRILELISLISWRRWRDWVCKTRSWDFKDALFERKVFSSSWTLSGADSIISSEKLGASSPSLSASKRDFLARKPDNFALLAPRSAAAPTSLRFGD